MYAGEDGEDGLIDEVKLIRVTSDSQFDLIADRSLISDSNGSDGGKSVGKGHGNIRKSRRIDNDADQESLLQTEYWHLQTSYSIGPKQTTFIKNIPKGILLLQLTTNLPEYECSCLLLIWKEEATINKSLETKETVLH